MRRILSFAVLAALYFPGCNPLTKELVPTGYMPYNHRYLTMKQYKIITKHLGDPYEDQGIDDPIKSLRLQPFIGFAAFSVA